MARPFAPMRMPCFITLPKTFLHVSLSCFLFTLCHLNPAQAGTMYSITDLGIGSGFLAGINDNDQVLTSTSIYQGGTVQVLPQPQGGLFVPKAINNLGQVAGYVIYPGNPGPEPELDLATYSDGTLHVNSAIKGLTPIAINDAGQIAGDNTVTFRPFLYSGGDPTVIGADQDIVEAGATGMNAHGDVVGFFDASSGPVRLGFEYINGEFTVLAVNAPWFQASAINNAGQITGYYGLSAANDTQSAVFIYSGGQFQPLGSILGDSDETARPSAINNNGIIVGTARGSSNLSGIAWAYVPGSGYVDLNSTIDSGSGWQLQSATGINDNGRIIGYGQLGGQVHGFLLTPTPEPGSAFLLAAGSSAALMFLLRRRARP